MRKKNQKEAGEKRKINKLTFSRKYKRWIGLIVYPFFMLFTSLTASGQNASLAPLLNLDFEKTRTVSAQSDAPLSYYYANLADVLELILLENEARFGELHNNQSTRLNEMNQRNKDSPWTGFVEAEIKMQWAFVNFKYGKDWDAFWGLRSAYRRAQRNNTDFPNFEPNKRTLGVLNIIFGNVPSKNQWLMNLFGLRGDVFTGLSQLTSMSTAYPELANEASLILSMANVYLLEDFNVAVQLIEDEKLAAKPLYLYIKSLIYLKAHSATKARSQLSESIKKYPVHDYLIAETYFQSGDYPTAITHYKSFLESFKDTSYIKDAYLKLGISYGFLGDVNAYNEYLDKSKNEGEENTEVDKNSVKLVSDLDKQNPIALKIRFAIDGGYYSRADSLIQILDQPKALSNHERLALNYRKARLAHLQGDSEEALIHYREVISNTNLISETYYGPNSFLQMGYLMRQQGDTKTAKIYFNQVLSFREHPYKSSLDTKAKIALKQLDLKGG